MQIQLEKPSRVGSAGRPGSGPKARLVSVMKSLSVTIEMKATEQHFPVILAIMLYKVVLQSDPFAKRHANQESLDFPLGEIISCLLFYWGHGGLMVIMSRP